MKQIIVKAITEKGNQVIEKDVLEFKNAKLKDRFFFKKLVGTMEVLNDHPYQILFTTTNPAYCQNPNPDIDGMLLFKENIEKKLKEGGLSEYDYEVAIKT